MNNYVCKIATLEDIIKKYDYEIEKAIDDKNNWIIWKEKAIERFNKGLSITYMGLLGGEIISECTAAIDPTIVKNSEGLIDNKTAYLFAFRTNKEYQGKGYFSILFKFMINDLISRGYERVTLGVEPEEERNRANVYGDKHGIAKEMLKVFKVYRGIKKGLG